METEGTLLRRLARDQWVRLHGTPRVTVLAGDTHAREVWDGWLASSALAGTLLAESFAADIAAAVAQAIERCERPIAVLATPAVIRAWRAHRSDRLATMVDEGLVVVTRADTFDAKSAAEAAMFEALEATAATAGQFELNGRLAVRFGPTAAEVDLLARGAQIAIEIDGYHHFTDADAYRRDRRKDVLLQSQGLLVIRLLAEDVLRDPRAAVNVVCQGLAARRR